MPTQKELRDAARLLTANLPPQVAASLMSDEYNTRLKEEEDAKVHPMDTFTMSPQDWQAEKAHMMDGGGVVDDSDLAVEIMTAMNGDDQATFWPDLIHVYKSWAKTKGYMTGMPGGGTFLRGVSAASEP